MYSLSTQKNDSLEKAHEAIEPHFESIYQHTLYSISDLDGNIISASVAFCKINGYQENTLIDQKTLDIKSSRKGIHRGFLSVMASYYSRKSLAR